MDVLLNEMVTNGNWKRKYPGVEAEIVEHLGDILAGWQVNVV